MHEAFYAFRLIRGNHYDFECISCFRNYLLVGTKSGQILIYEITPSVNNHPDVFIPSIPADGQFVPSKTIEFSSTTSSPVNEIPPPLPNLNVRLCATHSLCKKRVLQIQTVPEYGFFLALSEFHLGAYSLRNRELIAVVPNSRGATHFAIQYQSACNKRVCANGMLQNKKIFNSLFVPF